MPNPTILPPLQSPPERRYRRRAHAKRSKEGEIKAQEGNKDGNKIIGDIIGDFAESPPFLVKQANTNFMKA